MKKIITLLVAMLLLQLVPVAYVQRTDPGLIRIWITDDTTRMIYEFTTDWELLNKFGFSLPGSPPNVAGSAIAIDPTTDPRTLWVVREKPGMLINLSKDGTVLSTVETQTLFNAYGPEGVDVDPSDYSLWFVTDPNKNADPPDPGEPSVFNITKDGTFIASFPTADFDPSSTSPQSIAVDPVDGTLWLVDNVADKTYHITKQGGLITSLETGELVPFVTNAQSISIAIDRSNGTLWITDRPTHTVVNLTREGEQLSSFDLSSIDLGPDTIFNPTGVAFERIVVQNDLGEASNFVGKEISTKKYGQFTDP